MADKTPKPLQVKDPGIAVASTNARTLPVQNVDMTGATENIPEFSLNENTTEIPPFIPDKMFGSISRPGAAYSVDGRKVPYSTFASEAYRAAIYNSKKNNLVSQEFARNEYPTVWGKDGIQYPDYPKIDTSEYTVFFRGRPLYINGKEAKYLNHSVFSNKELGLIRTAAEKFSQDPAILIAQRLVEDAGSRSIKGNISQARTWDANNYMMKKHGLEFSLPAYFASAGKPYVYKRGEDGEIVEDWEAADYHIKEFNKKVKAFGEEWKTIGSEVDEQAWFLKNAGLDRYNRGTDTQFGFNYADRVRKAAELIRGTEAYKKHFSENGK